HGRPGVHRRAAYPGHPAERGGDRPGDLAGAGLRAAGLGAGGGRRGGAGQRNPGGPVRRAAVARRGRSVSRRARGKRPAAPVELVERWLRHSGVPAFVTGYSRPAAVIRRWPWVLVVAVLVAAGVLVAAIVAGYGS